MERMRAVLRVGYVPFQLIVVNGAALLVISNGTGPLALAALLSLAIGISFASERILPHAPEWNRSRGDGRRDVAHAVVNEALNAGSVASIPLLAGWTSGLDLWPRSWPFALQVLAAIPVLDLGITLAHHASHRWSWLWRFHAVHHSAERLYGFNGLMKHPVHQGIEMAAGSLPLVLLGMPIEVGMALAFCTAVQLLVQHSNVDFSLGPLRPWIAAAEIHRLHHRRKAADGNVNFGLFTTLGDRLLGTCRDVPETMRLRSADLGIEVEPDYPRSYVAQLLRPFSRRSRT